MISSSCWWAHHQHNDRPPDEGKQAHNQWFDDIDEKLFSFNYQTYNWIRQNKDDQKSNSASTSKSSRSSKHSSKSGKSSLSSKSSSRERAIKEKLRMVELMAEVSFIEKKHSRRYEAGKLELEEMIGSKTWHHWGS